MKNIILGSIFVLAFLPQLSFGQNMNFNQRLDAESVAFFQKQAQERAAFISGNIDLIHRSDHDGKHWAEYNAAQRAAARTGDYSKVPAKPRTEMTADDQNTLAAFMQKQQSEKVAFLNKLAQERQRAAAGDFTRTSSENSTPETTAPATTPATTTPSGA